MSNLKICDQCKIPIMVGMPTYYVTMGLRGIMNKTLKSGDLCHICYNLVDKAVTKIRDEVRK